MLLELAIGDAYGAGFEYAPATFVAAHNDLAGYVAHPRHTLAPGAYTDDTQMSLAIAETLLAGDPWTPAVLAEAFVCAFKRDQRQGYSRGFYGLLQAVADGAELRARLRPQSDRSGAAMRAAPLGVLPTPAAVLDHCRVQAAITHATPDGIHAAQAAALTAHYFLYRRGPRAAVGDYLAVHVPGDWTTDWTGPVGEKGWMSVRAALTALRAAASLADLLRRCVAFTGDVDTVAAIALAAGAHCPDLEPDLPQALREGLERGPYGYDYLADLDRRLLQLVTTG